MYACMYEQLRVCARVRVHTNAHGKEPVHTRVQEHLKIHAIALAQSSM